MAVLTLLGTVAAPSSYWSFGRRTDGMAGHTLPGTGTDLLTGTDLTVVVPTYEERENIRPVVDRLEAVLAGVRWNVIFVDDDSRDGTPDEVRRLAAENPRVSLLSRIGRRGLAGACIEGMLSTAAPIVAVMDADLQHDERLLSEMFRKLSEDTDLHIVIGSRHVGEGSASGGLSKLRSWGSDRANALVRRMLGVRARDPMSGFFMLRRSALTEIVCGLQPQGFKLLADMLSAGRSKWNVLELPYDFRARTAGHSKMNLSVVLEFLALILSRLSGGLLSVRFVLFAFVGISGILVQLAAVRLALAAMGPDFALAQTLAVIAAMTSNFVLNNRITWRERRLKGRALIGGILSFYAVCGIGALANVLSASALYNMFPDWWIASIAGALVGAVWNFWASLNVTWRAK